jgi:hypothetical protein
MYLAVLVSNNGTWMQTVGAQWLLVDQVNAAVLVPLVQVMDTLPVVVTHTYSIAPEDEQRFIGAMRHVRMSRLRTGATEWGSFRDGATPRQFVELFLVPSWEEHLRQHSSRLTGTDRQFELQAEALSHPVPKVSHLIGTDVRR